jgi:hypothetical protein
MKRDFIIGHAHAYPSAESVFTRRNGGFCLRNAVLFALGTFLPRDQKWRRAVSNRPDDIASKVVFAGYRFLLAGLILFLFALVQRKPVYRLSPSSLVSLPCWVACKPPFNTRFSKSGSRLP